MFGITILHLKNEEKPMVLICISDNKANSICGSKECNICQGVIEFQTLQGVLGLSVWFIRRVRSWVRYLRLGYKRHFGRQLRKFEHGLLLRIREFIVSWGIVVVEGKGFTLRDIHAEIFIKYRDVCSLFSGDSAKYIYLLKPL